MEEDISRAFYMACSAVLFVIAMTLLLIYQNKLNDIYDNLYHQAVLESVLTEVGNVDVERIADE
jgi:hypothetical protein